MEISDINFYLANTSQERASYRTHVFKGQRYYDGRNWPQYSNLVRYAINFFLNEYVPELYQSTTYSHTSKGAVTKHTALETARKEAPESWLSPSSRFGVECLFPKMPSTSKPLTVGEEIIFLTKIIDSIAEMFDVHLIKAYEKLLSKNLVRKAELPLEHPMSENIAITVLNDYIQFQDTNERREKANILKLENELQQAKSRLTKFQAKNENQHQALASFYLDQSKEADAEASVAAANV